MTKSACAPCSKPRAEAGEQVKRGVAGFDRLVYGLVCGIEAEGRLADWICAQFVK